MSIKDNEKQEVKNLLGTILEEDPNNENSNRNEGSRLEVLRSIEENKLDTQKERNNLLLEYDTPPPVKKYQHNSTGQLNGINWGGSFPLFSNWNSTTPNTGSNNQSPLSTSNTNLFDNGINKNKSRSQELLGPEFSNNQPLSLGITPLKYLNNSYRNSWDSGMDMFSTNHGSGNTSPTYNFGSNSGNNSPTLKISNNMNGLGSNNRPSLFSQLPTEKSLDDIPKNPIKLTPSSTTVSPYHQWAINKSKKLGDNNTNISNNNISPIVINDNEYQVTGERYADTDFSEHVEHPSRTLFVRNLANNVDLDKLKELFEKYGPIRNMYTQAKYRGFVMISFFDIRHAKAAKTNLQSKRISGKKLDIHFALPKDTTNGTSSDKVVNQGTLVVFNLDATITNEQLIQVFGKYGEIKDIRETPNKKSHKFIEFFDVRDAQKALIALNKTQIGSKTIKIEPSRPGGSGKNVRRNSAPSEQSGDRTISIPLNNNSPRQSMNFDSPSYQPSYKFSTENNNNFSEVPLSYENSKMFRSFKQNSLPQVNTFMNDQVDQNIIDINLIKKNQEVRTTLMIRNIPNKYTQALLLESIDVKHKGRYDFFYLPIDFGNKCNMGYAFINLITPHDVISFYETWNDCRWSHFNSDKVCSISFARIQGRSTLEQHFLASSVMTEDKGRRPMFFDNGIEVTDQLILQDRSYQIN